MQRSLLLTIGIVIIVPLLASCDRAASSEPPPTLSATSPEKIDWDDRTIFESGLIPSAQGVLQELPGATIYHIDLAIPTNPKGYTGRQTVYYTNCEKVVLGEVYFRLFANVYEGRMEVSNVKVDGVVVEPIYEAENSALRVPLIQALQPGASVSITMDFTVTLPKKMSGNYGLFGYFEEVLVLDLFYPVIPAYDTRGWYAYYPYPNGDFPFFDASFYIVNITAPSQFVVIASGILLEEKLDGNWRTSSYAAGPARDFYVAASTRFTKISATLGETTVHSYAFIERAEGRQLALQTALDALASFNERFGIYPYTEFDVVSTPMLALGIEYPGIIGISTQLYDPDGEVSGLPAFVLLESATAHEVGHQWFYNAIGNDQMAEPWIDEALVQYITGLYFLDKYGQDGWRSVVDSWNFRWARVDHADIPIGLPAGDYKGREYSAIVYGRGPLFIDALANYMGQDTFDAFLRDYYESYLWEIAYAVDFKTLAEAHCSCDLTPIFKEWVLEK